MNNRSFRGSVDADASRRRAAFFDMDRTVLRIDSGMSWMRFQRRRGELSALGMARAMYWSGLYFAALLDLEALARRLVGELSGQREDELIARLEVWHRREILPQVSPRALRVIKEHRARNDLVVLATGSTQYVANVVAESIGIDHVLCSQIEVRDGRFTGELGALCFGPHKVGLAETFAEKHGIDLSDCAFYSDSYNDLPMLSRVGTAVAVNPDTRLRRHAVRNGWPIENWT